MKPAGHEIWMNRALELAREGEGMTRPNPPVGAVVVSKGRVVGEGFHHRAGEAHAEILAIREAGARARGATLYVTLEPCCTWGKTPPCTEAILKEGLSTVVVSVKDPNPKHAGRGLRRLRQQGVNVITGICRQEGSDLLAPFAKWVTTGLPWVTLKMGATLDGKIADARGASRWITGPAARRCVQQMRRRCDAILVGKNTICLDNPRLTPRPAYGRKPYRVVVAGDGSLPARAHVLSDAFVTRTIVAATRRIRPEMARLLHQRNAGLMTLPARRGQVSLRHLMKALGGLGVLHVLCEGGGALAESLIREGLVDQFHFFISPSILGGSDSISPVRGKGWNILNKPLLHFVRVEKGGEGCSAGGHTTKGEVIRDVHRTHTADGQA
ncbi:MAG: bifunctional diaminohydroxyphosphoribosylaminopyrimidine deaminase/5-amino-6-(5-phosphoribosylamino)uracil reductase RibD [Lentisphaerota bacterium]